MAYKRTPPSSIKILVDHGDKDKFVGYRVRIDPKFKILNISLFQFAGLRHFRIMIKGILMFINAQFHRNNSVVVSYGNSTGFIFACCQYLFIPLFPPITHVMFDLLLDEKRKGILHFIDSFKAHIFNKTVSCATVWGHSDVDKFSSEYGLIKDKLIFHPYHITLDDIDFHSWHTKDDNFIFCGGNVGRDFETVINALGPLGYPLFIATQVKGVAELARNYPNITVRGVTPIEFRHLMASSTFVIEAHPTKFYRTAGHQTMLNAMFFGKPIILVDKSSAEGYIRDGIDGVVIDAQDTDGLSQATKKLWEDKQFRKTLAKNAKRKASNPIYRTLNHMQSIYNLAIHLHEKKNLDREPINRIDLY